MARQRVHLAAAAGLRQVVASVYTALAGARAARARARNLLRAPVARRDLARGIRSPAAPRRPKSALPKLHIFELRANYTLHTRSTAPTRRYKTMAKKRKSQGQGGKSTKEAKKRSRAKSKKHALRSATYAVKKLIDSALPRASRRTPSTPRRNSGARRSPSGGRPPRRRD